MRSKFWAGFAGTLTPVGVEQCQQVGMELRQVSLEQFGAV